jgi:hypothetical protein
MPASFCASLRLLMGVGDSRMDLAACQETLNVPFFKTRAVHNARDFEPSGSGCPSGPSPRGVPASNTVIWSVVNVLVIQWLGAAYSE